MARRVEEEMCSLGFNRVCSDEYGNVVGIVEGATPGPRLCSV